jgi:signal transduction histidine kinase
MLNPEFDPLKILDELAANQQTLYQNDKRLSDSIQDVRLMIAAMRVTIKEQQETIDILINGLAQSNKKTEQLLSNLNTSIYNTFQASGQH